MYKVLQATVLCVLGLASVSARPPLVKVGDKAPDFSLPDQNGDIVTLRSFQGRKNVVLVFFGQVYSEQSTARLRSYQQRLPEFQRANTQVIGITVESVYLVEAFATDLHLTFPVLSDYGIHFDKRVSQAYGVFHVESRLSQEQGMLALFARFPDPYTILVDKRGIVQHVQENASPEEVLEFCKHL
jgi:mycoredoxin-dependent peroxiredoxin